MYPSFFKAKPIILKTHWDRIKSIAKGKDLSPKALNRLEWLRYYYTKAEQNALLTCRHFGISKKTFYKWKKLFKETDVMTLEDRTKRPMNVRRPDYKPFQVERLQNLHQTFPTLGREKLLVIYRERYGESLSPWYARRIMSAFNLKAQRALKKNQYQKAKRIWKKRRISELIKEPFAGFLLELDSIVLYFADQKRYVLTAIDYHSRFAFAHMYKGHSSKHAADFLRRLYHLFDGHIRHIHIDNGSEFKKDFEHEANHLGITLYHARPYQPKDKPLIERFNGILKQEFINLGNLTSVVDDFNKDLIEWIIFYNFIRPHHALGLQRPIDFVRMKTKVLPMYSHMTQSCSFFYILIG